jgi:iron complex outermembrane receptor protein
MNINVGHDLSNFGYNSYEYSIFDFSLEYNWQIFKSLSIRPGVNVKGVDYQSPITDSLVFSFASLNNLHKDNDERSVSNSAFYVLSEWKPTKKLRFIAGLRSDTFDLYRTSDVNYEIAATYRINKNNLVRLVNSKASRAPFIFDTYLNCLSEKDEWLDGARIPVKQYYTTSNQLKYPTNYTLEAGWRCKLKDNLNFDLEVYTSALRNMLVSVNNYQIDVTYRNDIGIIGASGIANLRAKNYNTSAYQNGLTFNVNYNPSEKISTNVFASIQKTTIKGKTDYLLNIDTTTIINNFTANKTYTEKAEFNFTSWSPKSTPNFYGGFLINCQLNDKVNVNFNSYFYTKQYFINNLSMDDEKQLIIDPWVNLNFKVSYNPFSKFSIYATANNILGKHRELAAADNIVSSFWFGLQWGF